jgi:hypothetical protein
MEMSDIALISLDTIWRWVALVTLSVVLGTTIWSFVRFGEEEKG